MEDEVDQKASMLWFPLSNGKKLICFSGTVLVLCDDIWKSIQKNENQDVVQRVNKGGLELLFIPMNFCI